ncbi:hypothetical protein [Streptomyces griseosporeus]|uniref:hypothetical protein n=1 Tax=Streptomyces griseosporeus TaxID=1910 RepID=UPI00167DE27A|nr:hypothetical protein [Streptomyces griseosporeus]GHF38488.1 hypothetical protein GCM10018783_03630 [Streptomyces griseosporeus]
MSLTLTDQDKQTLRTAAYGAVSLLAAAGAADSPHRIATQGSIALASATGPIGHVLAEKSKVVLKGKTTAAMADEVLPALTSTMTLLKKQDEDRAADFRSTVLIALETATRPTKDTPSPAVTDMIRKITDALDAA